MSVRGGQALGRSASSRISGAAGAKLKTLESGLRLYEGYLGTAHPAMSQVRLATPIVVHARPQPSEMEMRAVPINRPWPI